MAEYKHWCGNCQIRVYIERHYGKRLNWSDCPYTCDYATAMRCFTQQEQQGEVERQCLITSTETPLKQIAEKDTATIAIGVRA